MNSNPPHPTDPPPRRGHARRPVRYWLGGTLALLVLLVGALAICEWQGWPMLRRPAEDWASQRLGRQVSFAGSGARWRLHLLGGVRLQLDHLEVDAPTWSTLGATLVANDVDLKLHYHDLFAFRRGQPLRIKSLEARTLALRVQRLADGRASWQFAAPDAASARKSGFDGVRFELLKVGKGMAIVDDRLSTLSMTVDFALQDASDLSPADRQRGLHADAEGRFRGSPLKASLQSGSALPWLASDPRAPAVNVVFKLAAGQASLDFTGQLRDLMLTALQGDYVLRGPSLAAVGEPLGVTLPTTPPFAMQGSLNRKGDRWATHVVKATVGRSVIEGDFVYDRSPAVPMLSGQLHAPQLWLADLGPAIGTRGGTAGTDATPRAGIGLKVATPAPRPAQSAQPARATRTAIPGRVLPNRPFDLPSLRVMNADVKMRIDRLESGSERLQAIQPLNTHLVLQDGVLTLNDIDARLAEGRLAGRVEIDGRQPAALWQARLDVRGVKLEQWLIRQTDKAGAPPLVTGRLAARVDLTGRGRSTADFLASAGGSAQLYWTQGTVSHELVEMSGIDVAQTLGLLLRGDDRLPVTCATADLKATDGMVRPQYLLIDTPDSAIRVDGGVSLATERLGLTLRVAPKDISPLALRTPVDVGGTFAKPEISLQKGPLLARRIVPAIALAAVTPLAALLPLIDTGDKSARAAADECQAAVRRQYAAANAPPDAAPSGAGTTQKPSSVGQH